MDMIIALEKEKEICIKALKVYNLKYKTTELKKVYTTYDYLLELLKNETDDDVKVVLKEDIEIIMEYLSP